MGRICITIPDETEAEVRRSAAAQGATISAFICAQLSREDHQPDQMSDPERAGYERTIADLRGDLAWTRGELAAQHGHLQDAIQKIPAPVTMLSDGKQRPSWWDRFVGRS